MVNSGTMRSQASLITENAAPLVRRSDWRIHSSSRKRGMGSPDSSSAIASAALELMGCLTGGASAAGEEPKAMSESA
jgi:hypothetical protein